MNDNKLEDANVFIPAMVFMFLFLCFCVIAIKMGEKDSECLYKCYYKVYYMDGSIDTMEVAGYSSIQSLHPTYGYRDGYEFNYVSGIDRAKLIKTIKYEN